MGTLVTTRKGHLPSMKDLIGAQQVQDTLIGFLPFLSNLLAALRDMDLEPKGYSGA